MQIKYKIIKTIPEEHQILVRFYSDECPESKLVSAWEADGVTPRSYRTDYLITLPVPVPNDLEAFILRHCPVFWFDLQAKIADPATDTSLTGVQTGSEKTTMVTVPVAYAPTERDLAKQARAKAVSEIKVTTAAGNTFDGDEVAQTRMARAIIALNATASQYVTWVLADNTTVQATAAELTEALALSGAAQAALWVL